MSFRRRHLRIRRAALGLAVAVAAVAAPVAQATPDPGTGVAQSQPSVRAGDYGMPRAMPSDYARNGAQHYEPFVTDFPQPAPRSVDLIVRDYGTDGRGYTPASAPALVSTPSGDGFDWADAGAGFALAAGLALAAAGAAIASRGRDRLATGQ